MTADAPSRRNFPASWLAVERGLLLVWVVAALVTMVPRVGHALHLSGTLFTSYAADLTNPAWVYLFMRRRPSNFAARWLASRPFLAVVSILTVGVASELGQRDLPRLFNGTFDPKDIAAFAIGLGLAYTFDQVDLRRGARAFASDVAAE